MARTSTSPAKLFDDGMVSLRAGRLDSALAAFEQVVRLAPRIAAGHHLKGIVLQNLGRLSAADAAISRAIVLDSRDPDSLANRALVRVGLKRHREAIEDCVAALMLAPVHQGALNNLGLCQIASEDYTGADETLHRLTRAYPAFAQGHGNLGIALNALGRHDEAARAFEAGLALSPDNLEILRGLGDALRYLGDIDGALRCYRRAIDLQPDHLPTWSSYLFILNYDDQHSPAEKSELARQFGKLQEQSAQPMSTVRGIARQDRPLRIGFVSGDLRQHSVSLFMLNLLPELARFGDQLFAYATHPGEDDTTLRLRPNFADWRNIAAIGDLAAARQIADDRIDILIDLSGHSSGHRLGLFALRPAPLSATWLGYPATTGLTGIDYIIADGRALPVGMEALFTERPLRLPGSFLCFSPHPFEPPEYRTDRPITFGSFNSIDKLSQSCIFAWSRILTSVPGSRLMIKDRTLASDPARQTLRSRFSKHGIDPERLLLMGRTATREEHFDLYGELTMALDPFPYAGTTTTMEALTAGVPVLTLCDGGFANRVGASILATARLDDWIAYDIDDYVERAVALVDLARRPDFHRQVRAQVLASPLCDPTAFAAVLHSALHAAWRGDAP